MNEAFYLAVMRAGGAADAAALRARAAGLDGTALIREESKIPSFDPARDYSAWPVGAPVRDGGQVYGLLQPYNAANYPQRPAELPALWSIRHTRDAGRAKPYVAPNGTSGVYSKGECCTDEGRVYRSTIDNNVWAPASYPAGWEEAVANGAGD